MSINGNLQRNLDLIYRLRGLGMAGTILHIGAHPDDEDVGLLAYMARKFGARIVYWSATRGEGAQNRIGPEKGEALGVYRTWESLAARAVDGGEALFGPFYDFGFSKSGEETLAKWGRTEVVREIVRAIRLVQPHIVIGRWTGQPSDGHGHHQAIGAVTLEAFDAAGDSDQFPELQAQGLAAWQPRKLYYSMGGDWQPGEEVSLGRIQPELERNGVVRINTGEFDPISGRTYQQLAWLGYNNHRTQALGFTPDRGDYYYYYSLVKSVVPIPDRESSFYDGLDPSLSGLADYPGNGSTFLRGKLAAIKAKTEAALAQFRGDDPSQAAPSLLEGLYLLRTSRDSINEEDLGCVAWQALDMYLEKKLIDFEEVAAQCLGLNLECLSDKARITPGQQVRISSRLWNHRGIHIDRATITLLVPDGWESRTIDAEAAGQMPTLPTATFDVTVPETASLACPYWLVKPRDPYRYKWPTGEPSSRPFVPSLMMAECKVNLSLPLDHSPAASGVDCGPRRAKENSYYIKLGSHHLTLREPAVLREAFAGGFRELAVAVIPPISLHPKVNQEFLPVSPSEQHLELQAVARNNMEQSGVAANLKLEVPAGWQVEPSRIDLVFDKVRDARTVRFTVTIPEHTPAGDYPLRYVVQHANRQYGVVLTPIRMGAPGLPRLPDEANCTKEEFITAPAVVNTHLIAARFVPGLNYAYVKGAAEEILEALSYFDLNVHLISDAEMGYIDLNQFDAVIIGPNAYLIRDELRKNSTRFLEYVAQGGTLIVQYQGYGYQGQGFTPYPFRYNQPHDRVTFEDAPVTILNPDHFLVKQPNEITDADFDGWSHDRGLYFFGEWDERYVPILACNDPGEELKKGGFLATGFGRGTYLYSGYSFFRQLPAGVPGAFRLFANILALPMARILERANFLKGVSLFAYLNDEQLQNVARLMSERWVKDGEYLCHEGDEGHEMYIIAQGEVEILKESTEAKPDIFLALRKEREAIGEMAVLAKAPRTAAMRAKGNVRLLVIEGAYFRSLMHQHPDISDGVIQILVQKLTARVEAAG